MSISMLKPAVMLFVVTLTAGLLLGGVNALTEKKAREQEELALMKNLEEIFPGAKFEKLESTGSDPHILSCYEAKLQEDVTGYIIETAPNGYGGSVKVLTGVDADGYVQKIKIGSHSETPGLGANAVREIFTGQYEGKSGPFSVVKTLPAEDEIQAITSATITSTAVTQAVNQSVSFFNENFKEGSVQ